MSLTMSTCVGSVSAGIWRIFIMPVDTVKTCLQVCGSNGTSILYNRFQQEGIKCLYSGSIAASAATFVGHYPWFLTYNTLSSLLPTSAELHNLALSVSTSDSPLGVEFLLHSLILGAASLDDRLIALFRSAFIGLCASSASDITSNSLRVLKTSKQTNDLSKQSNEQSYLNIAKQIIDENGLVGLFTRGLQVCQALSSAASPLMSCLQTRLLVNALQGMLFSVLFKYFNADKR
jgi:hypothetical protein